MASSEWTPLERPAVGECEYALPNGGLRGWNTGRRWAGLPFLAIHSDAHEEVDEVSLPETLIGIMDRGRCSIRWREGRLQRQSLAAPGTATFLRAGHRQTGIEADGDSGRRAFGVLIRDTLVERWLEEDSRRALAALGDIGPYWNTQDPFVLSMLRNVHAEIELGCPLGAVFAESVSLALLVHLTRSWAKGTLPSTSLRNRGALEKVSKFIDENISEELSLNALAVIAHVSPRQLARMFRHSFGTSVHQYVLQRRVERAKAMLETVSVTEAALATGFASPAHFSTVFRSAVGIPPTHFRRAAPER